MPSPKQTLLALALLGSLAGPAQANPWTREAGSAYAQLSYSSIATSKFYGPNGDRADLPGPYSQQTLALYGEAGLVDRWLTATIDWTLLRHASLAGQASVQGMGDLRLGFWSGLLVDPLRVSVGLVFGLPTGDPVPQGSSQAAQPLAKELPTGDGELDAELTFAVGRSFGGSGDGWPLEHYALAKLGYWLRTTPRAAALGEPRDFPDSLTWHAELGTRAPSGILNRVWLILKVYGTESPGESTSPSFSGLAGDVRHRSFTLELRARLWRSLSLGGSVAGAFSARNLPSAPQWTLALSFEP